ncbi:excinuclease ABC subunit C [Hydrogenispora ethanolica]|uniref:UvrABC system protein C n=1 Tax=Hydrogenispora ethanolica TaxID=1082276 RepID=A0A4R1S739_HYDET|nr:excinuclease ABC subunit UvrC [Hydrogenispora ethanolica]TCL75203.1 excinuclease ABC subunit C [Hydrogenispora ethanolica]
MVTAEDLKILPDKPGVYMMKDSAGKIIYVGKAVSLRNRVRSYFQASRNLNPRIQSMVNLVDRVEYITTNSEVEALVLECNLIKQERPKYNVRLRDDKQYPWVKITMAESYPQVYITRQVRQDGSKYYGPYTNVSALRDTFRLLRQLFPLRGCRYNLDEERIERPCLNYHIRRCLAPCTGLVPKETYRELIQQVCLFLEGRQEELVEKLRHEMGEAAARQEYERAAQLRDRLRDVQNVLERQKVVSDAREDTDIFGIAQDPSGSTVQVFQVRGGKLVGREYFQLAQGDETPPAEVLEAFITQYYDGSGFIPKELWLPCPLEGMKTVAEWLAGQRGNKVNLLVPQKGEKAQLVKMAAENAQILLEQERNREKQRENFIQDTLDELQRELFLEKPPLRIEGFDISNTQGQQAVASMVVFENGLAKGSEYRRFRIRTVEGPNDFAMMQEALRRRFRRGLEERQNLQTEGGKFAKFPDLLLIDGGKGQLSAVSEVLAELGLEHLPRIGLAKQEEEIYLPDREEPVRLSRRSEALKLLQRVRDEAHRFAITYHKSLRDQRTVASSLDLVTGIGPKKKQALLKHFGSVKRIREASLEELMRVEGINAKLAESIKEQLELV